MPGPEPTGQRTRTSMGEPIRLSVVIITHNEERNIGRCLDSVRSTADEVVVVDSGSSDSTVRICRENGARLIEQEFLGYVEQKNFAVEQASYDHVLALDADECLSDELRVEVEAVKGGWRGHAFTMNRRNNYYGAWIRRSGMYPDRKLRLWDRRQGRWGGLNPHDKVVMHNGAEIAHLPGDLLHYAYDSIASHARQANRFSSIAARAYLEAGRSGSLFHVFANPTLRFVRDYVVRGGFLDGFNGLMVCSLNSYMTFLKYAKLRVLQGSSGRED